jgi:hypothetical protein
VRVSPSTITEPLVAGAAGDAQPADRWALDDGALPAAVDVADVVVEEDGVELDGGGLDEGESVLSPEPAVDRPPQATATRPTTTMRTPRACDRFELMRLSRPPNHEGFVSDR